MKKMLAMLLVLAMLVPTFVIVQAADEKVTYCRMDINDPNFSKSSGWGSSGIADSTGSGKSLYVWNANEYVEYKPQNLKPGWYKVSFWNIKYNNELDPIPLTATVYASGETCKKIKLPSNQVSEHKGGIWSEIGVYYFDGTNDEYVRLVATGNVNARVADMKFEYVEDYLPRIFVGGMGFSKSSNWNVTSKTNDSTGLGDSMYSEIAGEYAEYKPAYLEPGWYKVSFWNIKSGDHQDPMKMNATVYANGVKQEGLTLPVNKISTEDKQGIWSEIGAFYFAGTGDEYVRLIATGGNYARPADVKFEKTTYTQRIEIDGAGFTKSSGWSTSSMPDSAGNAKSLYTDKSGEYVKYQPSGMEAGWYKVSFWNLKYDDHQDPIKMNATVCSHGKTYEGIQLAVNKVSENRGGIWTEIGTFYFDGTNDEYVKLISTGGSNARSADVKFELVENYVPRVSVGGAGFSKSSGWTSSTMPDSVGNAISLYSATAGEYVEYKPIGLEAGWYKVSFWNIKNGDHQDPMKMTANVYANNMCKMDIPLPANKVSADRGGIWSEIGIFYFAGTGDETVELVATGGNYARPADVKFEKTTYTQRIAVDGEGFTKSSGWTTSSMPDSAGVAKSLYTDKVGEYAEYKPTNMEAGWYKVSFWNIKYQEHQDPMKMSATIYSQGRMRTDIVLPVNKVSADRGGIWSEIGTFYFDGTNDEYVRLVSLGSNYARPADVKFEFVDNYVPDYETIEDGFEVDLANSIVLESLGGAYKLYTDGITTGALRIMNNGKEIAYAPISSNGSKTYVDTFMLPENQMIEIQVSGDLNDGKLYFEDISDEKYVIYSVTDNTTNGTPVYNLCAGDFKVEANVSYPAGGVETAVLLVAVFEKTSTGDVMIGKSVSEVTALTNNKAKLSCDITLLEVNENCYMKIMVWDSFEGMYPLTEHQLFLPAAPLDTALVLADDVVGIGSWRIADPKSETAFSNAVLASLNEKGETTPATFAVNCSEAGTYVLWARGNNKASDVGARHFKIAVNGVEADATFGNVAKDGYYWEDGGTVTLNKGENIISVIDSSCYYARVDAILLTKDVDFVPSEDYNELFKTTQRAYNLPMSLTEADLMKGFEIEEDFSGGNVLIDRKKQDVVFFRPDLSDSSADWFYWNFKATSDIDRTVTFVNNNTHAFAFSGVAYSYDGENWQYLTETAQKHKFTFDFKAGETVQFSCTIPYVYSDLTEFIETCETEYADKVDVSVLCKSEAGRDVPLLTIGNTQSDKNIVFTSRHHSCEATASFLLEGLIEYLATEVSEDILDEYCFYIVPMMDVDGVENGDQGKARIPHDHNRDYDDKMYRSVKGLTDFVANKNIVAFMDFHCPGLDAPNPYFYYSAADDESALGVLKEKFLSVIAQDTDADKIVYTGKDDYDGSYTSATARGYFRLKKGAPLSTTLELPYSGKVGDEYTPERIANFGKNFGKAFELYLETL